MSRAEKVAQDKRVIRELQGRIDELRKPAESKSAVVRARVPSARAQAAREARATAKRDESLEALKRLRELVARGELPAKSDVLARRPVTITEAMADKLEAPSGHRPPQMSVEEIERLASDPGRSYAHHPESAIETPSGRKSGGGPNSGGDSSFEPGAEAGVRQRAVTQQRLQEKAVRRSLPKQPKSPKK